MPVPVPKLGSYQYVEQTKEDLDWADLVTVDLSQLNTEEGKKEQAQILISALRDKGFFYVKNFNISQERVDRQFAIGRDFFELPEEVKESFIPEKIMDGTSGNYNGYVHQTAVLDPKSGLKNDIAAYNIPKFDGFFPQDRHPEPVAQNLAEIEEFSKSLHNDVVTPLMILLAVALELPEDYFTNIHRYEVKGEDHLRYMKYLKRTEAEYKILEDAKLNNFLGGHSDLGCFSLLFRQPVAGLQIRYHSTNEWKWVKPQDATITVNSADALSFLTGGYVKSTVHRVNLPPKDQRHVDRLGVLYFARANNDVVLRTASESPVLQREGYTQNEFEQSGNKVPTMDEWAVAKQRWQRRKSPTDVDIEQEIATATLLPGYKEKIYL